MTVKLKLRLILKTIEIQSEVVRENLTTTGRILITALVYPLNITK